jgi:hypothetical protein
MKPIIPMSEIVKIKTNPVNLPEPWSKILGDIPKIEQWSGMIFGYSQSGKSSFALKMADVLSKGNNWVLYNAAEEKIGTGTISQRLRRMQVWSRNIDIFENKSIDDLIAVLSEPNQKYKYVFIDSVNRLGISNPEIMRVFNLQDQFKDINFIFIVHGDKDAKNYLGSAALQNMVSVAIEIKDGNIIIKKNYFARKAGNETNLNVFHHLTM